MDIANSVVGKVKTMLYKINWTDDVTLSLSISGDANKKLVKIIANEIIKCCKLNKIPVLKLNGFITEFIALQISGLLFNNILYETLKLPSLISITTGDEIIKHEYKNIFIDNAIRIFINDNYVNCDVNILREFRDQFKIQNNMSNIDFNKEPGKFLLIFVLSKYVVKVTEDLIPDSDNLNFMKYYNSIHKKKAWYDKEVNKLINEEEVKF